jgi:hypothetical protein
MPNKLSRLSGRETDSEATGPLLSNPCAASARGAKTSMHRKTELSKATDGRLKAYSLAAMAAGVSALALAQPQPVEAEVVVTDTRIEVYKFGSVSIDLNNDGTTDFTLSNGGGGYDHSFYGSFVAIPLTGGKVIAGRSGSQGAYASALANGAIVGPSAQFSSAAGQGQVLIERSVGFVSASTVNTVFGKWGNASNQYLGVKFLINGKTHYGWIQMSTNTVGSISATITAYAYETDANTAITIGSTADGIEKASAPAATTSNRGPALGMLALGADGLGMWRR